MPEGAFLNTFRWRNLLLVLALALPAIAQDSEISINRIEISRPWTGFYYEGQGSQLWGKAIVQNNTQESLEDGGVKFEFYDSVGPRESFTQRLPVVPAGGISTVESPLWWDYSGAQIELRVTIYRRNSEAPVAERTTGDQQ